MRGRNTDEEAATTAAAAVAGQTARKRPAAISCTCRNGHRAYRPFVIVNLYTCTSCGLDSSETQLLNWRSGDRSSIRYHYMRAERHDTTAGTLPLRRNHRLVSTFNTQQ